MKVKFVDGFLIRNTLDDDFGNICKYDNSLSRLAPEFYIPEDEIWIDHCFKDEKDFILAVDDFIRTFKFNNTEIRDELRKKFCLSGTKPNLIIKSQVIDGVKIQDMDGALVRQYLDPEFIFGGHDLVYSDYIPLGEIWLDAKMDPAEREFILLHEQVERDLMSQGKSYAVAHEFATVSDKELRRARGVGFYPGDANYPWRGLSNAEIINKYYV